MYARVGGTYIHKVRPISCPSEGCDHAVEHQRPVDKPCSDLCRSDLPITVREWGSSLVLGHGHQRPNVDHGNSSLVPACTDPGHAYEFPILSFPDEVLVRHSHGLQFP
jgi:hypothetical protein